jgi:hypothetical protein
LSTPLEIPEWARTACGKCESATAWVRTSRKSRGQYVEIEIDVEPDSGEGGTVMAQATGGVLYGNPVSRTTAASLRAAGRPLYGEHKMTCTKRNGTHKRS